MTVREISKTFINVKWRNPCCWTSLWEFLFKLKRHRPRWRALYDGLELSFISLKLVYNPDTDDQESKNRPRSRDPVPRTVNKQHGHLLLQVFFFNKVKDSISTSLEKYKKIKQWTKKEVYIHVYIYTYCVYLPRMVVNEIGIKTSIGIFDRNNTHTLFLELNVNYLS